ncbi:MAG: hypothetical protein GY904_26430 [Planctomycetaceae bacterium]|nr:hypothetical protein [Planctomycetaceae bacterium]
MLDGDAVLRSRDNSFDRSRRFVAGGVELVVTGERIYVWLISNDSSSAW